MPASAIQSRVKRQVLKAILFALPKAMNYTASRIPAFAKRLKQRDLVAWIGLMDGSIGRIVEIKGGRFRARSGPASEAQVAMSFKDVETATSRS
jgi:trimethylamine-N-oxide reductase (cytochrome c)